MQNHILTVSGVITLNPAITVYDAGVFKGESIVSGYYVV